MKRMTALLLVLLSLLLGGCAVAVSSAQSVEPTPPSTPPKLLSELSLEEKVGQLFFVRVPEAHALEDVSRYHLGGFILFGRDVQDQPADAIIQTLAAYQDAARIPLLIGTDEEGGTVVRLSRNPSLRSRPFSSPQQLMEQGGMEAVLAGTRAKDRFLHAFGINVNLGPVADVSTDPEDFIYPRTLGRPAQETADYVGAVVAQMRADGMGSVLKHFPGYGGNVDTHTGIARDSRPLSTFQSSDFLPFQAGIDQGAGAIMVSHNIMEAVDPDLPASLSPAVHQLLRTELGFEGVIMTDDLAMDAVAAYAEGSTAALLALQAGNDMIITTDYQSQIPALLQAVEDGTLSVETIDRACARVLAWKASLGLLEQEVRVP